MEDSKDNQDGLEFDSEGVLPDKIIEVDDDLWGNKKKIVSENPYEEAKERDFTNLTDIAEEV
jgi:hypothetical protein